MDLLISLCGLDERSVGRASLGILVRVRVLVGYRLGVLAAGPQRLHRLCLVLLHLKVVHVLVIVRHLRFRILELASQNWIANLSWPAALLLVVIVRVESVVLLASYPVGTHTSSHFHARERRRLGHTRYTRVVGEGDARWEPVAVHLGVGGTFNGVDGGS